jgi:hypothetical protein
MAAYEPLISSVDEGEWSTCHSGPLYFRKKSPPEGGGTQSRPGRGSEEKYMPCRKSNPDRTDIYWRQISIKMDLAR